MQYLILLVPSHPDKENHSKKPVRAFLMLVSALHKLEIPCVCCAAAAHDPECTHTLTSHTHSSEGKAIFQTSVALRGAYGSVVKHLPANAGDIGDVGSIPGLRRSPGEGNGNSLQYSCPGNPVNRGAWWAPVHEVTRNETQGLPKFGVESSTSP